MRILRRMLYLQAAVWAGAGIALAAVPRPVLVTLFDQPPYPDYGFVRIAGIASFALALLMVLVARRSDQLWWWSWAFVIAAVVVAVVAVVNALFGLTEGSSSVLWWLTAALNASFAAGLVWGLGRTGQERPLP